MKRAIGLARTCPGRPKTRRNKQSWRRTFRRGRHPMTNRQFRSNADGRCDITTAIGSASLRTSVIQATRRRRLCKKTTPWAAAALGTYTTAAPVTLPEAIVADELMDEQYNPFADTEVLPAVPCPTIPTAIVAPLSQVTRNRIAANKCRAVKKRAEKLRQIKKNAASRKAAIERRSDIRRQEFVVWMKAQDDYDPYDVVPDAVESERKKARLLGEGQANGSSSASSYDNSGASSSIPAEAAATPETTAITATTHPITDCMVGIVGTDDQCCVPSPKRKARKVTDAQREFLNWEMGYEDVSATTVPTTDVAVVSETHVDQCIIQQPMQRAIPVLKPRACARARVRVRTHVPVHCDWCVSAKCTDYNCCKHAAADEAQRLLQLQQQRQQSGQARSSRAGEAARQLHQRNVVAATVRKRVINDGSDGTVLNPAQTVMARMLAKVRRTE